MAASIHASSVHELLSCSPSATTINIDGETYIVDADCLDDIDTVELLGRMVDGDIFAFPLACKRILGEDGYEKVKMKLALENGRTRATDMVEFIMKVLQACGDEQAKN